MPRAIAVPVRRAILQRCQRGQDAAAIAQGLELPVRTVRHLLLHFRRHGGQALTPAYRGGPAACPAVHRAALDYRRRHPLWGAELIRIHLRRDFPDTPAPCARSLRRLFARAGLAPAAPGRKSPPSRRRAESPHQVWQMDAAEHIALRGGQQVSWLRLVDECSGAFLATTIFPPGALARRRPRRRAPGPSRRLHALGAAGAAARGQRLPVGPQGRPAHRPGAVADRPGRRAVVERAAPAAAERRGGAAPGHGQELGRAAHRRQRPGSCSGAWGGWARSNGKSTPTARGRAGWSTGPG